MRIVKRKRYYYMQHSYRKGNQVITREKYLGKTPPNDLTRVREHLMKEAKNILYAKLEGIKRNFQDEWKKIPPSAQQHELAEIAIAFIYNTNRIEGSTITIGETREITRDNLAPHKPLRDIKETENHYATFLQMLAQKSRISSTIILQWHKDTFGATKPDIAGAYRDYLVRVGPYLAPDWQDIEELMHELIKFIGQSTLNPVELVARAHYRFEKLHPFGDGNGRIGRLLINHILWHAGYPMLIIEYKGRKSYYKALERNEDGFTRYFMRRYLAVHSKRYGLKTT